MQASGDKGFGQSPAYGPFIRTPALAAAEQSPGQQGRLRVHPLMRSGQAQFGVFRQQGQGGQIRAGIRRVQGQFHGVGPPLQGRAGVLRLGGAHRREHARPHGVGLVRRDGGDIRPQHRLMVQADGGEANEIGGQGCGGVVATAQAGFKNQQIGFRILKGQDGHNREQFKISKPRFGRQRPVGQPRPRRFGQGAAIHADAFRRAEKMGRGIQAGAKAVGHAQALQKGGRGAFAVGARHLHHGAGQAGDAQRAQRAFHTAQAHIHMKQAQTVQMGQHVGVAEQGPVDAGAAAGGARHQARPRLARTPARSQSYQAVRPLPSRHDISMTVRSGLRRVAWARALSTLKST